MFNNNIINQIIINDKKIPNIKIIGIQIGQNTQIQPISITLHNFNINKIIVIITGDISIVVFIFLKLKVRILNHSVRLQ